MGERVAVVTGANAGLGYAVALRLAGEGARVVMACRSRERAAEAREEMLRIAPEARLEVIRVDISEPASVRRFVEQFSEQVGRLDLLVNNAGIVGSTVRRNSLGHEMHFATNYLGAFALTGELLPLFDAGAGGRIVNVGSLAHRLAKLDLDDPNFNERPYKEMPAYGQSKLALLTFTQELDRRLKAAGSKVMALAAHPGFAHTNIGSASKVTHPKNPVAKWVSKFMESRIPEPEDADRPILYAASNPDVRGGEYYGPGGWLEIAGEPAPAKLKAVARDVERGKRLWALSESLTGVSYLSDV